MRVSVVIPSYESDALLLEALASVQAQEGLTLGEDLEVVVAGDRSLRPDRAQAMAHAAAQPGVLVLKTTGRNGPLTREI
jgi:GT2 family glycosyltransferase